MVGIGVDDSVDGRRFYGTSAKRISRTSLRKESRQMVGIGVDASLAGRRFYGTSAKWICRTSW
ncbi:hypothetical protein [Fundicoccus culcitae]|uniref:Uncharacterized protein n=1 Tax=Fundicoccus culcitae TaxID=2969821 RepID=A0ABY5P9Q7_9LACT|nr:hypothetical protein [Fundicoccus culcitae]UUX35335.1 hypothetical protein NRE15_06735 [Fundicoccus culcitae]